MPANVLSFPLTKNSGEIVLNIAKIKREASKFGFSPQGHAKYLLIHGCLHLKGYTHGSTMEQAEERLVKKFSLR
jgi:probable rRNA maturation factor